MHAFASLWHSVFTPWDLMNVFKKFVNVFYIYVLGEGLPITAWFATTIMSGWQQLLMSDSPERK